LILEKIVSMELNDEDYKKIEDLAGCNYSPDKIAMYLNVDAKAFLRAWNDKASQIRFHYDRGILIIQAEADMKLVESAKTGNITAYQQYQKQSLLNKIDNLKKKQLLDSELDAIDKLQEHINNGSDVLPAAQAQYYNALDFARSLYDKYENNNFIITALMKSYPDLAKNKKEARLLMEDSINFFHCDNTVKQEAWCHIYADRFEQAAAIALEINDLETFAKLMKEARDSRMKATEKNDYPDEFYRKQIVLYYMNIEKFGQKREDRTKVAKFINSLPDIPENELVMLRRDAEIPDADFKVIDFTPDAESKDQQ
jgi:hypothetical protein